MIQRIVLLKKIQQKMENMKMKKTNHPKNVGILSALLGISLLLSACSASPSGTPDSGSPQTLQPVEASDTGTAPVTEMFASESSADDTAPDPANEIYHMGDTIEFSYLGGGTIKYTLENVKIGTDINEMELSPNCFIDSSVLQADGTLTQADSSLVAVWVTVKNVDADMSENVWNIESNAGNEENLFMQDSPFVLYGCYSSEWSGESQKDFYLLHMEPGEERLIVTAWLVPNDQLESPFYYVIGGLNPPESWKYFLLSDPS